MTKKIQSKATACLVLTVLLFTAVIILGIQIIL